MVGHYRPSVQAIPAPIKRKEGILDQTRYGMGLQPTGAPTPIKHFMAKGFWAICSH
jgi:hypothetical protein